MFHRIRQLALRLTRLASGVVAVGTLVVLARTPAARADDAPSSPFDALNAERGPDLRPAEVRGMNIENKLGDIIPTGLTFTNVDGGEVKLAEFFNRPSPTGTHNKPVVLMMVYYRCPILCPLVLEKFTKTLNQIEFTAGTEFDALVVSFDPKDTPRDSVQQRANQLLFYKPPTTDSVRDGWNFLTCDKTPENAKALADALGFPYRYVPGADQYSHGAAVFVLTPEGKISRYLLGMNYPARDVRLALIEAGQGKIGSLVDRFTFWCYHYDPTTGSYTLVALRVMQIGAAGCAIALGGFIGLMFAHERRKRRRMGTAASFRGHSSSALSENLVRTTSALAPALGAGA